MSKHIAIVTGGIGGLGTEICKYLARSGHVVVAADLASRNERIEAFRAEVAEFGAAVIFEALNVGDFQACADFIKYIEDTRGPVSILVNAAGITRDTSLRKMAPEQWGDVLKVNLEGVFNMCRHVVDGMTGQGFGRIVNISSVNGQTGQFGQTNYSAAKAGMHGFTMALAREVAKRGVTVNSVSPGYCKTAMVMAVPEDIRNQIIASDSSRAPRRTARDRPRRRLPLRARRGLHHRCEYSGEWRLLHGLLSDARSRCVATTQ